MTELLMEIARFLGIAFAIYLCGYGIVDRICKCVEQCMFTIHFRDNYEVGNGLSGDDKKMGFK